MDFSAAFPTFVVTLREGVEASLVVGIVLACLQKAGRRDLFRWAWVGIGVGAIASIAVGVLLGWGLQWLHASDAPWASAIEPLLKTFLAIAAIAALSWMLIWMTRQARSLKAELQGSVGQILAGSSAAVGVFALVAIAVLREGFEAAIFILAKFQQGWTPALGAIAGIAGAVAIATALFRWGVRINLQLFFQVMGTFLLLVVAGLVVAACKYANAAALAFSQLEGIGNLCWTASSCLLGPQLWNLHELLPDKKFPGLFLKAFLGYRDRLYLVQAIAYLAFLLPVGTAYWRSLNAPAPLPAKTSSPERA